MKLKPPVSVGQNGDPKAWARALRRRELFCEHPRLTKAQSDMWRAALLNERNEKPDPPDDEGDER